MEPTDGAMQPGPLRTQTSATTSSKKLGKQPAAWEPDQGPESPSPFDASSSQHQLSKRRRGIGVVTPNACNECRKKRVKCDGRQPCGRCRAQRSITCVYELPVRQSKEDLRNEIESLRSRQRASDSVLSALARSERWEDVVQRLRGGHTVDDISEWLDGAPRLHDSQASTPTSGVPPPLFRSYGPSAFAGPSFGGPAQLDPMQAVSSQDSLWSSDLYPGYSQTTCRSRDWASSAHSQSRVGSWVDSNSPPAESEGPFMGLDQILPLGEDYQVPSTTWTNITDDPGLIQHLLALYFCWEYPTFASLSKEHFLEDFQAGSDRYCSSMLVNALLSLGCRFSAQPSSRADPGNPYSAGDHFFQECQRQLNAEPDHHKFTTIQALGVMSIREASCGRDSESWYYAGQSIRLAIEMGLHEVPHGSREEEDVDVVKSATFWGAFALDHAWSIATGSLPQCSFILKLPPKPAIISDVEESLWIPYSEGSIQSYRSSQQPSNVRSVYACFCDLSELVHQSLYLLHSPGRPLNSRALLNMYTEYLNWYDTIPMPLRLGHNFTPAVLFAHMYYQFAILLLFRPLIKLRINGSSVLPRDICLQAADAIQGLLRSYAQLYTLKRTPSFVPYFVLTASIMHLAIGATSAEFQAAEGQPPASGADLVSQQDEGEGSKVDAARPKDNERKHRMQHSSTKMDPRVAESINRSIADLTEMAPCHHFAEQALSILRFMARKWNIDLHVTAVVKTANGSVREVDSQVVRQVTTSLNFPAPNLTESDFNDNWGESGISKVIKTAADAPSMSLAANHGRQNPLFWPFPLHGHPILESGEKLKEAGFSLIA